VHVAIMQQQQQEWLVMQQGLCRSRVLVPQAASAAVVVAAVCTSALRCSLLLTSR
jgi:hypothetical protein